VIICRFENINSIRSCLIFTGDVNFVLTNVSWLVMGGVAIGIAVCNPSYWYSFFFCTFEFCKSICGYGGGFFFAI
jgi:hypothetical protein